MSRPSEVENGTSSPSPSMEESITHKSTPRHEVRARAMRAIDSNTPKGARTPGESALLSPSHLHRPTSPGLSVTPVRRFTPGSSDPLSPFPSARRHSESTTVRSSSLPSSPSTTILRLRDRIRQLEADAINLQDDSAQYRSEYLRIQRETKGFFSRYAQKCQKLKMMQERQDILLEQIKKREELMRQLNGELDGEKKKAFEWKQKYKTQCHSFKENYEAFKALRDEYETLTGQLSKVGLKMGRIDGEEQDIIESLAAQLDELEKKKGDDEKDRSLAEAREQVAQLQAKVKEMDAALESRVAKFASTATTVASLRQDSPDRMRERVETLSISNDILREERASLEKELQTAKAKIAEQQHALIAAAKASSKPKTPSSSRKMGKQRDARLEEMRLKFESQIEEMKKQHAMEIQKLTEANDTCHLIHMRQLHDQMESVVSGLETEMQDKMDSLEKKTMVSSQKVEHVQQEVLKLDHALQSKIESENKLRLEKLRLDEQISELVRANRNIEEDMRLVYKKHRQELRDLEEKYQAGEYIQRYEDAVVRMKAMEEHLREVSTFVDDVGSIDAEQKSLEDGLHDVISEFEVKVNALAAESESFEKKKKEFEEILSANEELRTASEEMEAKIANMEQQMSRLQDENGDLCSKIESLEAEVASFGEREQEYVDALARQDAEIMDMKEEVSGGRSREEQLLTSLEERIQECEVLSSENEKLKESVSQLDQDIDELARNSQKQHEMITVEHDIRSLLSDICSSVVESSQQEVLKQNELSIIKMKEQLAEAAKNAALEVKQAENTETMEEYKRTISILRQELVEKESRYEELVEFVDEEKMVRQEYTEELEQSIAEKDDRISALEKQKSSIEEHSADSIATLTEELRAKEEELETSQQRLHEMQNAIQEIQKDASATRSSYLELESAFRTAISEQDKEKAKLVSLVEEQEKRITEMAIAFENEKNMMEKEMGSASERESHVRAEIVELQGTIQSLQREVKEKSKVVTELTEQRLRCDEEITCLRTQLDDTEKKLLTTSEGEVGLKHRLSEADRRAEAAERELEMTKLALEKSQLSSCDAERRSDVAEQNAKEMELETSLLRKRVQGLQESLSSMQERLDRAEKIAHEKKKAAVTLQRQLFEEQSVRSAVEEEMSREEKRYRETSAENDRLSLEVTVLEERLRKAELDRSLLENERNHLAVQMEMLLLSAEDEEEEGRGGMAKGHATRNAEGSDDGREDAQTSSSSHEKVSKLMQEKLALERQLSNFRLEFDATLELKESAEKDLKALRDFSKKYKDLSSEKIRVLKENLEKAEKEVKELDSALNSLRSALRKHRHEVKDIPELASFVQFDDTDDIDDSVQE
eukprot:TRINITY_DN401_c0_g3_i1.p1 TRINITY_DN401_c0_g3~~TRINITY_DN401_c0_g3_i1.p1  ORF type:complete len:1348 (+),score=562.83 TRINITY_DN401_c0_g3_i1:328-4371(+)